MIAHFPRRENIIQQQQLSHLSQVFEVGYMNQKREYYSSQETSGDDINSKRGISTCSGGSPETV